MYLSQLKLKNFRNFQHLEIKPDKKINIFYGKNGQGKTNIAESIYIIFNGKSFRKCKRQDLIYYTKEYSEIRAEIELEKSNLNLKLIIERDKRKLNINEKTKKTTDPRYYRRTLFLNSDLLFHCKNFLKYRIALLDKLCFLHFGENFRYELKKYKRIMKQYMLDRRNNIWTEIFLKQRKKVNEYREMFINEIKKEINYLTEKMNIGDVSIFFNYSQKTDLSFIRKDKKDLSLGEFKSIIFSLIVASAKLKNKSENILIIDDFNSEWDNEKICFAIEILNNINLQSFIMSSEVINIYPHFLVEKGEVKRYEGRES